ncbi:hypothetical protein SAMN04244548_04975 [Paracoccus pantotrophus]|nr:hypothetical protein SAMN04244548_04975 [Paracoccus pantotrophus]
MRAPPWRPSRSRTSRRSGTRGCGSRRNSAPTAGRNVVARVASPRSSAPVRRRLGIAVPEAYGGTGIGITEAAVFLQAMAEAGGAVQAVFDRPIGQNKGIRHPLAQNWAKLMMLHAARLWDEGKPCRFRSESGQAAGLAGGGGDLPERDADPWRLELCQGIPCRALPARGDGPLPRSPRSSSCPTSSRRDSACRSRIEGTARRGGQRDSQGIP